MPEIQQTLSRPTLVKCGMLQSHRQTNCVPLAVDRKQISTECTLRQMLFPIVVFKNEFSSILICEVDMASSIHEIHYCYYHCCWV